MCTLDTARHLVCVCVCVCVFRKAAEHHEAVVSDAVEEGAALCLGQELDFLQKELERLQVLHVCVCVCMCGKCSME